MAKSVLKKATCSLFCLFVISCSIPPPYSRDEVPEKIKSVCKNEYNLDVNAWNAGETLWVFFNIPESEWIEPRFPYKPSENKEKGAPKYAINDLDASLSSRSLNVDMDVAVKPAEPTPSQSENAIVEKLKTHFRHIFEVIHRSLLNTDNPPAFYCLIISSVKSDLDDYTVVFVPDMIKFQMRRLSLAERTERTLHFVFRDPNSKGDVQGNHIKPYDISANEFVFLLVMQNIEKELLSASGDKLPPPLEPAQAAAERILNTYSDIDTIAHLVLRDNTNETLRELTFKPSGTGSGSESALSRMYKTSFYLKLVAGLYKQKEYDKAESLLLKALKITPDYPYALDILGLIENQKGKYQQAIDYFTKVLKQYPENLETLEGMGQSYYSLADYKQALAYFEKFKEAGPEEWQPLYDLGFAYNALADYTAAVNYYRQALDMLEKRAQEALRQDPAIDESAINKYKAEINSAIGSSFSASGEYELAQKYITKSLDLDHDNYRAQLAMGMSYQRKGDYQTAVDYYQKALKTSPESLEAHLYLGRCYVQLGQFAKALEFFNTALKYSVSTAASSAIYVDIGLCYTQQGLHKDALKFFDTALKVDPTNYYALSASGFAYLNLKEYDKAVTSFQAAIKQNDTAADSYRGLGLAYFYAEKYRQARPYFEKAKELFQAQANSKAVLEVQSYLDKIPE